MRKYVVKVIIIFIGLFKKKTDSNRKEILRSINGDFKKGELTAVMGPSGIQEQLNDNSLFSLNKFSYHDLNYSSRCRKKFANERFSGTNKVTCKDIY